LNFFFEKPCLVLKTPSFYWEWQGSKSELFKKDKEEKKMFLKFELEYITTSLVNKIDICDNDIQMCKEKPIIFYSYIHVGQHKCLCFREQPKKRIV